MTKLYKTGQLQRKRKLEEGKGADGRFLLVGIAQVYNVISKIYST